MNIDRKSLILIVLLAAIALLLFAAVRISRESPRINTAKLSGIFIAKDWPTNRTDMFKLHSDDFQCVTDYRPRWTCMATLEGKRLDTSSAYMLAPYQTVTDCHAIYNGRSFSCEVNPGSGWGPLLVINGDLGISAARMAELRAQRPFMYMEESTWMGLGTAWASTLAFLTTLVLLTLFNKIPGAELLGVRLPIWMVCLTVIVLAALINQVTGAIFFLFPLGAAGVGLLLMLILRLNRRDRKHGPSLAHPAMWASVSLVAFWVTNIVTLFGLMALGFVD